MLGIGSRIKQIREFLELTQEEFGKQFSVSNQTVSNWETGIREPELDNIVKIAEMGKVSLDFLILGTNKELEYKKKIEEKDIIIRELMEKYSELQNKK